MFAIAITLLILELKVPPAAIADLRTALPARWPSYLAYFTFLQRHVSSPRRSPALMRVAPDDPVVTTMRAQYRWGAPAYLAALTIAQWSPRTSMVLCLALVVAFLFPAPVRAARTGAR